MIKKLSHVGIVVKDIEASLKMYTEVLGFPEPPAGIVTVEEVGVKSALIPLGDNYIEIIQSTDPNSLVAQVMEKRGEGLLHICVEVDDIDAKVKAVQDSGVTILEVPPMGPIVDYKSAYILDDEATRGVPIELVPPGTARKSQQKLLEEPVSGA